MRWEQQIKGCDNDKQYQQHEEHRLNSNKKNESNHNINQIISNSKIGSTTANIVKRHNHTYDIRDNVKYRNICSHWFCMSSNSLPPSLGTLKKIWFICRNMQNSRRVSHMRVCGKKTRKDTAELIKMKLFRLPNVTNFEIFLRFSSQFFFPPFAVFRFNEKG